MPHEQSGHDQSALETHSAKEVVLAQEEVRVADTAEQALGEVVAAANTAVDQSKKETASTPELQEAALELEKGMIEVIEETRSLKKGFLKRLDELLGITAEGRQAKLDAKLAVPDNERVIQDIKNQISKVRTAVQKQEKSYQKRQNQYVFSETVPWDPSLEEELMRVAISYNQAAKINYQAWESGDISGMGGGREIGALMATRVAYYCKNGNLSKAFEFWKALPDLKEWHSKYLDEPGIKKAARAILDYVSHEVNPNKKLSKNEELDKGEVLLAGYPDLILQYQQESWFGYYASSKNKKDDEKKQRHLETLRDVLRSDRRYALKYFEFVPGWDKNLDTETKQELFKVALDSSFWIITNHFNTFKDQFDALSGEERQRVMQQVATKVGRSFRFKYGYMDSPSHRDPVSFSINILREVTISKEEKQMFVAAMLPYEADDKKGLDKGWEKIFKEQETSYNAFVEYLAGNSEEALVKNIILLKDGEKIVDAGYEATGDNLINVLIARNERRLISILVDNVLDVKGGGSYLRQSNGFSAEGYTRLIEHVLNEGSEEDVGVLAEHIFKWEEMFKSVGGLKEHHVDILLDTGEQRIIEWVLARENSVLYFDNLSQEQEDVFVDKLVALNKEDFFTHFIELLNGKTKKKSAELSTGVLAFQKYGQKGTLYDTVVFGVYSKLFREVGEHAAQEYMEGLREKARSLIGKDLPTALRQEPEYVYMVKSMFPNGNYSSYEENLKCGDKLEHVDEYVFDRNGYAVELTGLVGYKLSITETGEQLQDDTELYESLEKRLKKIRDFVGSRGPDNKLLQRTFDEKVATYFTKHALPHFHSIENLTPKEKMLALFISETVQRSKKSDYKPRAEVLDLIVEYKYAYHEDLEAYVHRSADDVKRYKDAVSQRYVLWQELSTIYGENVKHVLQHNIFEELAKTGSNYQRLVDTFGELVGEPSEERMLKEKQMERIRNTFANDRIPFEDQVVKDKNTGEEKIKPGRFNVLTKQMKDIFGSNIKFQTKEEATNLEDEISAILATIRGNFTFEAFQELLPQFFSLRDRYRFGINAKLEELFSLDLNAINREITKFEEIVEVEAKETAMNGPKNKEVKKSAKKRKIRGYFTKTQETANARMGAYVCIAGDSKMWENQNYFEFVDKDEETGKCVGVAMLLKINAVDGKKYLWFGPNPFESFLTQVSAEKTLDHMYTSVTEFAAQNGFDGVVVPSADERILGSCTNRGGNFPDLIKAKRLRNKKGELQVVDFGGTHTLGGGYGYSDGALVWSKPKEKK